MKGDGVIAKGVRPGKPRWFSRWESRWIRSGLRRAGLLMGMGAMLGGSVEWCGIAEGQAKALPAGDVCRKVVLTGEVKAGEEWQATIGEGWVFRVVPIAGQSYTGWDLVVDRAAGGGYPDALLLATPPYGSLSEREIGTTFGLRAQDALGWNPRHFHFLTTERDLARGRVLFGLMMSGNGVAGAKASAELLGMLKGASSGEFRVLDAKLSAGAADPPEFARQWSQRLRETPHTVEQKVGAATARGELLWMRFSTTMWFAGRWKVPAGLGGGVTKCAQ